MRAPGDARPAPGRGLPQTAAPPSAGRAASNNVEPAAEGGRDDAELGSGAQPGGVSGARYAATLSRIVVATLASASAPGGWVEVTAIEMRLLGR